MYVYSEEMMKDIVVSYESNKRGVCFYYKSRKREQEDKTNERGGKKVKKLEIAHSIFRQSGGYEE